MSTKPLEDEVAELERLAGFMGGFRAAAQIADEPLLPRLIADWRARGERIEVLEEGEGRRLLERIRRRLRSHCEHAYPDCDQDAHDAVIQFIDPIIDRLSWAAYDRAKKELSK